VLYFVTSSSSLSLLQQAAGDFPTVLYDVVNTRSSVVEGSLSVADLNGLLDELSENMGKQ